MNKEVVNTPKQSLKQRLKSWSSKNSLNPIIIGDKNFSLRLQSFFVSSPMLVHFDHTSMFDDYSEKNLLVIVGPLSEVQIEKIKRIKRDFIHEHKTVYLEMLFDGKVDQEKYQKEILESLDGEKIDHFLLEEFISLDNVATLLREIA